MSIHLCGIEEYFMFATGKAIDTDYILDVEVGNMGGGLMTY